MIKNILHKIIYNSTSIVMLSILIIYFIVYSNPIHAETQWSPEIYYIVKQPEVNENLYPSKKQLIFLGIAVIVSTIVIIKNFVK